MSSDKKKRFAYSFLLPMAILLSMTVIPITAKLMGDEIIVETVPYDPRDVFRGDYVALSYKINEVEIEKLPDNIKNEKDIEKLEKYRNRTVYAVLKKEGEFHIVDRVSLERPKSGIYLKSKIRDIYTLVYRAEHTEGESEDGRFAYDTIFLRYNIDRYFVPENTGKDLEKMSREGTLAARAKVYRGYAILEEIFPSEQIKN